MSVRTLCKVVAAAALVTGCLAGAGAGAALAAAGAGTAGAPGRPGAAATYPPNGPTPTPVPTPPPGGKLPFTGGQVLGMTAAGGGLGALGVLLVVLARRRHRTDAQ